MTTERELAEVLRFDCETEQDPFTRNSYGVMEPYPDGEYVRYSDYAALLAKHNALLSRADGGEDSIPHIRVVAKRNLRKLIELGSSDKATMLSCLGELS